MPNILKKIFIICILASLLGNILYISPAKAANLSINLSYSIINDKTGLKIDWKILGNQNDLNQISAMYLETADFFSTYAKTIKVAEGKQNTTGSYTLKNSDFPENTGFNAAHNYKIKFFVSNSIQNTIAENSIYITNIAPDSPTLPNNVEFKYQTSADKPSVRISFDPAAGQTNKRYAIFKNQDRIKEFNIDQTYSGRLVYLDEEIKFYQSYYYCVSTFSSFSELTGNNSKCDFIGIPGPELTKDCSIIIDQINDWAKELQIIATEIDQGKRLRDENTKQQISSLNDHITAKEQEAENKGCNKDGNGNPYSWYQQIKDDAQTAFSSAQASFNETNNSPSNTNTSGKECGCKKFSIFAPFETGVCNALCWISQGAASFISWSVDWLIAAAGIQ